MLWKTVLLLALVGQVRVLENGLLRTPPMGWLAWERFRCNVNCDEDPKNCISERLFMEMADRLAQDGWSSSAAGRICLITTGPPSRSSTSPAPACMRPRTSTRVMSSVASGLKPTSQWSSTLQGW
uniref:Alpha-N-acetylgalactosaminidase n=1 Tax=Rousettus aegyptiacus TaxID=9407 RepID=A0A7J8JK03_ROUAE|nr:alpha-N-acetylgalactosaminidase [Rousettus aegyptiacus]